MVRENWPENYSETRSVTIQFTNFELVLTNETVRTL